MSGETHVSPTLAGTPLTQDGLAVPRGSSTMLPLVWTLASGQADFYVVNLYRFNGAMTLVRTFASRPSAIFSVVP